MERRFFRASLLRASWPTAATAILGCILAQSAWEGPASAEDSVRVGTLNSLTGKAAVSGFSGAAGIKLAIKEINEAGGILGRTIELVQADDQSDPGAAVNEARRLSLEQKVNVVFGPQASQLSLAVAPILTQAKIPAFVVSGSPAINPATAPYVFSTLPNTAAQGGALVAYLKNVMKVPSVAILADDGANSKSLVEVLGKQLQEAGITLTQAQSFQFGSTDMTPQLLSLRRTNPAALIVTGVSAEDMGHILNNRQQIGWDVPVAGSTTIGYQVAGVVQVAAADTFQGVAGQMLKGLTYCADTKPGESELVKLQQKVERDEPNAKSFAFVTVAAAYDALHLYKAAVEGSKSFDADQIKAWIEANAGTVKTTLAPFSASPTNHFLIGEDALVEGIDLLNKRSDGLTKRAGC